MHDWSSKLLRIHLFFFLFFFVLTFLKLSDYLSFTMRFKKKYVKSFFQNSIYYNIFAYNGMHLNSISGLYIIDLEYFLVSRRVSYLQLFFIYILLGGFKIIPSGMHFIQQRTSSIIEILKVKYLSLYLWF